MNADVERIIVSDWRRWSNKQPQLLRPLTGGLTNRSFLIQAGAEQLVLRINAPHSRALDLDRTAEAAALKLANGRNLCPPLVYIDPDHRYLLTRFIHGTPLDLNRPGALPQLAQLLREIHQLPAISARLDYASKAERYWQSIDSNLPFFPELANLRERMQTLLQQEIPAHSYRLCHNDLLTDNLPLDFNGRLRAIDWEYAACGDPFFDVAVIAEGNGLGPDQRETLLHEYLQRPLVQDDRCSLLRWRVIYRYLEVLWYAVQFANGHLCDAQHSEHIRASIHRLGELAATPPENIR